MTLARLVWVEVDGEPSRRFYDATLDAGAVATFGDAAMASHALLLEVGTIRSSTSHGGSIENPSTTVVLRNDRGQATELLRIPPIGCRARVKALQPVVGQADPVVVTLLAGVVDDARLGETATLQVQA